MQLVLAKFSKDTDGKGPLLFMAIVNTHVSVSHDAIQAPENKLEETKLSDFEGEHVPSCTTRLEELGNHLELANRLPDNADATMCACLANFRANEEFRLCMTNQKIKANLGQLKMSWREILMEADVLFWSFRDSG